MANVIWKMVYSAQKVFNIDLTASDFVDNYENRLKSSRRKILTESHGVTVAFEEYFSKVRQLLEEQEASLKSPKQVFLNLPNRLH